MFYELLSKPTLKYCENAGDFYVKRPYYALSNISFLIVGVYILNKEKEGRLKIFGYLATTIAVASTLYDTYNTFIFQILDLAVMMIFANYLIFLNLEVLFKKRKKKELLVFCSVAVILSLVPIALIGGLIGSIIFGFFVFLILISEFFIHQKGIRKNYNLWAKGFSLFLLGFSFWYMDIAKIYCANIGFFNGRAIFHYLTAITVYYLYKFHKSNTVNITV